MKLGNGLRVGHELLAASNQIVEDPSLSSTSCAWAELVRWQLSMQKCLEKKKKKKRKKKKKKGCNLVRKVLHSVLSGGLTTVRS